MKLTFAISRSNQHDLSCLCCIEAVERPLVVVISFGIPTHQGKIHQKALRFYESNHERIEWQPYKMARGSEIQESVKQYIVDLEFPVMDIWAWTASI